MATKTIFLGGHWIAVDGETGRFLVQTSNDAPVEKTPVALVKTVTEAGTAEAMALAETFCRDLSLQARKAAGENAGEVYIGKIVNESFVKLFQLIPGQSIKRACPEGTKLNLADLYIDAASAGDGVTGWYTPV